MNLQAWLGGIVTFINYSVVALLFAVALVFFLANVARYFIINATDEKSREAARQIALYSILAFVVIVSIWGIVNILSSAFGVERDRIVCPDYMEGECGEYSTDPYTGGYRDENAAGGAWGQGAGAGTTFTPDDAYVLEPYEDSTRYDGGYQDENAAGGAWGQGAGTGSPTDSETEFPDSIGGTAPEATSGVRTYNDTGQTPRSGYRRYFSPEEVESFSEVEEARRELQDIAENNYHSFQNNSDISENEKRSLQSLYLLANRLLATNTLEGDLLYVKIYHDEGFIDDEAYRKYLKVYQNNLPVMSQVHHSSQKQIEEARQHIQNETEELDTTIRNEEVDPRYVDALMDKVETEIEGLDDTLTDPNRTFSDAEIEKLREAGDNVNTMADLLGELAESLQEQNQ